MSRTVAGVGVGFVGCRWAPNRPCAIASLRSCAIAFLFHCLGVKPVRQVVPVPGLRRVFEARAFSGSRAPPPAATEPRTWSKPPSPRSRTNTAHGQLRGEGCEVGAGVGLGAYLPGVTHVAARGLLRAAFASLVLHAFDSVASDSCASRLCVRDPTG